MIKIGLLLLLLIIITVILTLDKSKIKNEKAKKVFIIIRRVIIIIKNSIFYLIFAFLGNGLSGILVYFHNKENLNEGKEVYELIDLFRDLNFLSGINFVLMGLFINFLMFYKNFKKQREDSFIFIVISLVLSVVLSWSSTNDQLKQNFSMPIQVYQLLTIALFILLVIIVCIYKWDTYDEEDKDLKDSAEKAKTKTKGNIDGQEVEV